MKYFFTLLAIVGGTLMIMKSSWFVESFGRSEWGEHYLGSGGTYTMYKLIGLAVIIIAVLAVTGAMGEILLAVFGRMFGLK